MPSKIKKPTSFHWGSYYAEKENDKLDYMAGIEFLNKVGDKINKGDAIFRIFGNDTERLNNAKNMLQKTYSLTKTEILKNEIIIN